MFESKTYEILLEEALHSAPPDIDIRPGSIFYDAVSGVMLKIAKFYTDLDNVFNLVFLGTASGEYLDKRAAEHGVYRTEAAAARYRIVFTGSTPETGERFFTNGKYFTLFSKDSFYYLEAEQVGTQNNGIQAGEPAIPVDTIEGLETATFGEILQYGTEEETDDALRSRLLEKIAGPSENGNKQHYKTWCESIKGVGNARIFPSAEDNTVKGVIIGQDGLPATSEILKAVQDYVDPNSEGLGEGVANIGARFTAIAAGIENISVSFTADLTESGTAESVRNEAIAEITKYFKELALGSNSEAVVRVSAIGLRIQNLKSVVGYTGLKINGSDRNIEIPADKVPNLQEVTVNV